MNNEWKELDIANLPCDILVGDYEFEQLTSTGWVKWYSTAFVLIKCIYENSSEYKYRYSKRAPKAPTHEEIMTKWWLFESGNWERVTAFNPIEYAKGKHCYRTGEIGWSTKNSFTGREFADIPPEK